MTAEMPMITAELSQTDNGASQAKEKPWLISKANAAEMARLSHLNRKPKAQAIAEILPAMPESQASVNPLGAELMRVQKQLVAAMIGEKDAAEVSKLARALRDVRETYHLVTGQAKPGTQQPEKRNSRRQPIAQSLPEPDDTPQQVVSDPQKPET